MIWQKILKTSTKTACTYFEHTISLRHWYHKYKAYLNIYIYFGISHSAVTPQRENKYINSSISNSPVTCAPLECRGEMDNEEQKLRERSHHLLHFNNHGLHLQLLKLRSAGEISIRLERKGTFRPGSSF